jgi:hypothetical protein
MNGLVGELRKRAHDLAWSLWGQLGVSTWQRAHEDWAVEVEPLVAFTAFLAPHEPRLLRESVDWCVRHERFVSLHQLRHVLTTQRWPLTGAVGRFGATVGGHTTRTWPGAARDEPYEIALSGRSRLPDLNRPSLVQLRLRALLGVGARAEIVRVLVSRPNDAWTVTSIADRAAYTRRQVSLDLEMLELAGLVRRGLGPGPKTVAFADPPAVLRLVGPLPNVTPRWAPLLRLVLALIGAVEAISKEPLQAPGAELSRQLRLLGPEFQAARLQPPGPGGVVDVHEFTEWTLRFVMGLALGSADAVPDEMRIAT